MDDRTASPDDMQRENRLLARKLARMDTNVRQMEEMQDAASKLLSSVMRELDQERARSHSLLLNILPQPIIDRLGDGETIADRYDSVTVLFGDLVGFTSISSELEPQLLVSTLNQLFSKFDALCERTEVETIKTSGDAYLAVGGLPGTRTNHSTAIAELALGMLDAVAELNRSRDLDWRIRIGVHCGPAVAGVIGTRKFAYDVWGDTVNVASRLESSAEPNQIHLSEAVAEALRGSFDLERRGTVDLKGMGDTETYLLRGPAG